MMFIELNTAIYLTVFYIIFFPLQVSPITPILWHLIGSFDVFKIQNLFIIVRLFFVKKIELFFQFLL